MAVGDAARRWIERNLHDGAQQRLVTLSLQLTEARTSVTGQAWPGSRDRIKALGGRISLHSPPTAGTTLDIACPLSGPSEAAWES